MKKQSFDSPTRDAMDQWDNESRHGQSPALGPDITGDPITRHLRLTSQPVKMCACRGKRGSAARMTCTKDHQDSQDRGDDGPWPTGKVGGRPGIIDLTAAELSRTRGSEP